jgi:hypothetical protein
VSISLSQAYALAPVLLEAGLIDKKKFVGKYPHPWLLCEVTKLPQLAMRGAEPRALATESMTHGAQRMVATKPSTLALKNRTDSFLLIPIIKTDRNAWAERIFVGRASNNDIVLEDPSVSKAHAYFVVKGSRAQLIAMPALNSTKMNGAVLPPQASGVAVPDGAVIEFGLAGVRYLESASLYAVLTGKS